MKRCVILALASGYALSMAGAPPNLSDFEIDPRLKIELFATEPDVVDPVALTFDAAGRMYVVEMRDYPYGIGPEKKPGGTIRLIEDTDDDGRPDKVTLFAKDLSFPTSIAPWNGGVFVTAPPEILYLKDTNGDGVADVREVYFNGFVRGVTDSNANGLRWGLDNRLHGVNGGNGGTIGSPTRSQPKVNIDNADFSFDPVTRDLATTYQTSGGFGLVFDEFGRSFSTYNINHIQQRIIPLRYLFRASALFPVEATQSISDHEDMARIFPISVAQTRPNHPEQAGHFSSAGGLGFIGYDAYPEELYGSVTVGDVVGNLIHRDVLQTNGPIFVARRSPNESAREFLASRDAACRFTGLEMGPDGALYAIDMQRDVIEHPDYIPQKLQEKLNLRAGEDRGRIFRITPRDGLKKEALNLAQATAEQLVSQLESHNQWRRTTAQRLLVEKEAKQMGPRLAAIAQKSRYPQARVQALWTLDALRGLHPSILEAALRDTDPGVCENAVQLAEKNTAPGLSIENNLALMWRDEPPRVRFQLALTLGEFESERAQNAVVNILLADRGYYWTRIAALSSLRNPAKALAKALDNVGTNTGPADLDLLRDLADVSIAGATTPAGVLAETLGLLETRIDPIILAGLEGLDRGLARKGLTQPRLAIQPLLTRIAKKSDELFVTVWRLGKRLGMPDTPEQQQALQKAAALAKDPSTTHAERLRAIQLLRFGQYKTVREALFANLGGSQDTEIQNESLKTLALFRDTELAGELIARWPGLPPSVRPPVLNLLLTRKPFHNALVTALEKGDLKIGELNLDLEQRRMLLRKSAPDIQARAARLISDEEYSNRKSIVDDWLKKLPSDGASAKGRLVFEKLCAQCHRAGQLGHAVGPDLTSISHRSVEDIVSNILDPNMAINPKYTAYQLETKEGDLLSGIIESETPQSLILLQPGDLRTTVVRQNIAKMRATGVSLMPEGLEAGISAEDLRDLVAFLQTPEYK